MEIRQLNRTINADNIAYVNTLYAEIFALKAAMEDQKQRHDKQLATLREQLRFAKIHTSRLSESGNDVLLRQLNPNYECERLQRRVSYLENELARVGNEQKLQEMGQICTLDDALRREQRLCAELLKAKDAELQRKSYDFATYLETRQREVAALQEEGQAAREELENAYYYYISQLNDEIRQLAARANALNERLQDTQRQLSGSELYSKQLEHDGAVREQRLSAMQLALSQLAASRDALAVDFEHQSAQSARALTERLGDIQASENNHLIVSYQQEQLRANEALAVERSARRTLETELSGVERDKELLYRRHENELAGLHAEISGAWSKMRAKMLYFVKQSQSAAESVKDLSQQHGDVAAALQKLNGESQEMHTRLEEQAAQWHEFQAALEQKCERLDLENEQLRAQLEEKQGAAETAAEVAHILNIPADYPLYDILSAALQHLTDTARTDADSPSGSAGSGVENDTPTVRLSRRKTATNGVRRGLARENSTGGGGCESDNTTGPVRELLARGVRTAAKDDPYVLQTHMEAKERRQASLGPVERSSPSVADSQAQTDAEAKDSAVLAAAAVYTSYVSTRARAVQAAVRGCTADDLKALRDDVAVLKSEVAKIAKDYLKTLYSRMDDAIHSCAHAVSSLGGHAADLRAAVEFSTLAKCEDRLGKCIGRKLAARDVAGGDKDFQEAKDQGESTDKELEQAFAASLDNLRR